MNRTLPRGNNAPAQKERKPLAVQVLNYHPIDSGGALRGLFDVEIGRGETALKIFGMRHIRQEGQAAFCTGPQRTTQDDSGQKKYFPVVSIPRAWADDVLQALESYLQNHAPSGRLFGARQ